VVLDRHEDVLVAQWLAKFQFVARFMTFVIRKTKDGIRRHISSGFQADDSTTSRAGVPR